jgi:Na+-translocating ferredoxin:NAD+ oxidoreductase RnfD subunit
MIKLKNTINIRYVPPLFITLILLTGHFTFGILEGFEAIILAISASIVTELVLGRIVTGTWRNIASAYITGISVGILVRSTFLWPFLVTAVISIMSKYVIRYKDHHIWNPSNFGISWMLFFAPYSIAGLSIQWGNNLLAMMVIWALGLIIVWRVKRLHITLTYVVSFVFFSWLRSLFTGDVLIAELAPLTGPMYQLFVFFMITDPATTVKSKKGQMLVAFLIAFVEFVLRLSEVIYAPFYALFIVGSVAMMFQLMNFRLFRYKHTSNILGRTSQNARTDNRSLV